MRWTTARVPSIRTTRTGVPAGNVSLPKDEHRSLNGLILEELGHVPAQGDSFEAAGVRIDIVEASETQVLRARVTRLSAPRVPAA